MGVSRARQRAVLRSGDARGRDVSIWTAPRSAAAIRRVRQRSVRECDEVSGRRHRRPRSHERSGGEARTSSSGPARTTATRPASSASACFPIPTSIRRRPIAGTRAVLHGCHVLQRRDAGEAVPRRDVVRLLSHRAEPDQPASQTRMRPSGSISAPTWEPSISGSIASSTGRTSQGILRSSCFTRRAPGRSTRRSSPPTTSTTRDR